jgi:hypothetical protein
MGSSQVGRSRQALSDCNPRSCASSDHVSWGGYAVAAVRNHDDNIAAETGVAGLKA